MGVASQEAINQFKALMDQDFKFVESLERFLKAREGNVTKAHKMLVDSLQWRLQNGIDDILAVRPRKCVKVLDMSGLKLSALNQIKNTMLQYEQEVKAGCYSTQINKSTLPPLIGIAKDLSDSSSTKAWLEKMKTLFISKGSGFSSRSVITGDPYKGVGEIGIPFEIAQKITFEERVTEYNMKFLQKLVDDNLCLKYQDGQNTYSLREGSEGHTFLKPGQIVHRKIMEGDVIFINRPPTTHKHSLQALSVYIHDDHTFKINPLICGPLSADFDGDCIHIFYPQSPEAKAEVLELFAVEKQLLSSHKIFDRSVSRNETIRRIKLSSAHRAGTPLVPNLSKPGQPARLSRFGQFRGQTSQNLKDTKDRPHDTLTTVNPSRRYESRKTAHEQRYYRLLRSGTEMAIIPKPGLQMTKGQMIWKPNA
ncbi:hypothetical protein LXL04_020487 [Taraxacum kok-saghyz]